jgi:hypothetical protein
MRRLLLISVLSLPALCWAQETAVSDSAWGYSFTIPEGWVLQNKDAEAAMLAHEKVAGIILVVPVTHKSYAKMQAQMETALITEGMNMKLVGKTKVLRKGLLAGIYEGVFQDQQARGRIVGSFSSEAQRGCYVMGITLVSEFTEALSRAADAVARTVRY